MGDFEVELPISVYELTEDEYNEWETEIRADWENHGT